MADPDFDWVACLEVGVLTGIAHLAATPVRADLDDEAVLVAPVTGDHVPPVGIDRVLAIHLD
ncbi:hypothetical protein D9M72_462090 [compost metagenome]